MKKVYKRWHYKSIRDICSSELFYFYDNYIFINQFQETLTLTVLFPPILAVVSPAIYGGVAVTLATYLQRFLQGWTVKQRV